MANVYKNEITAVATTDITTVYTCPAETVALIKSISVYNVSASVAIDVTLSIYDASGTVTKAYEKKSSLGAATKYEFLQTGYSNILILEESDLLRVTCSTANGLNVMISVLQQDRT